jgi:Ca2+-binding RTX toxin-like protein
VGAGTFNLPLPTTLTNMQIINAQEGQPGDRSCASEVQTVTLRNDLDATVNVVATPANPNNPKAATINIIGAQNADVINLASGNDIVTVGSGQETVNGGSGIDEVVVTAAINGGTSGKSSLVVTGGGTVTMGSSVTNISTVLL